MVADGVLDKFKLYKKCRPFEAKRQLRIVIWGQFRAKGQLRTVFSSSFTFQAKRQLRSVILGNFEQQESFAQRFSQVLAS